MTLPRSQTFADPELEEAYQRAFARRWRGYHQVGATLLPILFGAFGLVDRAVVPEAFPVMAMVRFGFVVPVLLACLPLFFLPSMRDWYERNLQRLLLFEALVTVGGLLTLGALAMPVGGRLWLEASAMGLLIALSYVYGVSRLRFRYALLVSLATTFVPLGMMTTVDVPMFDLFVVDIFFAVATNIVGAWISWTLERDSRQDFLRVRELSDARARTERLLETVMPKSISERMRHTKVRTFVEPHDDVTVVLADIAGFTPLCEQLTPLELGRLLDAVFSRFDELCDRHGVLKIKTLGDGWLACAGVPDPRPDHVSAAAALAADMVRALEEVREETGRDIGLRIGLCTGPVVAGVIGRTRYAYDLWGEAVRGAVQMEQGGARGRVRLHPSTAGRLAEDRVLREGDTLWLARGTGQG